MRLILDDYRNISRFGSRSLIALASESNRLAALHSLVDVNFQKFLLGRCFLPFASGTTVLLINDLTSTRAIFACCFYLVDHGSHLTKVDCCAPTATTCASPNCAILSTLSFALGAKYVSSQGQFCCFSLVKLLESDVNTVNEIFGPSPSTLWTAEE